MHEIDNVELRLLGLDLDQNKTNSHFEGQINNLFLFLFHLFEHKNMRLTLIPTPPSFSSLIIRGLHVFFSFHTSVLVFS